ncbi:glycosyltransferase [Nocardioides sp. AE5]|uniref:glycosyltransferase n=1 Tax=Nocardioides sp. AE5 TaxID=2962573 RepID=UPI0028829904|nr:glycosyltransferase [Nocardioides sp. AE5]MDT0202633.1 glycosyltransferase [Nocardioides sp. AE5]
MKYVVRVEDRRDDRAEAVDAEVTPLPYYVGLGAFVRNLPSLLRLLWKAVREADVVVTRLPGLIGLLTVVVTTVARRPLALEVVGDISEALGRRTLLQRMISRTAARLTAKAVKRARGVRYVTQQTLQASYPCAPAARSVAFSSVQLGPWLSAPRAMPAEAPTIVAVGSQEQLYKGHDLLIEALPAVRDEIPGTQLVLIGGGRSQGYLRDLARQGGMEDHVTFAGHVKDTAEVIRHVDRGWVYAMPSRTEGLPRALVEAMSREKPCVASRVGGITELLDDLQLVDVDDLAQLARSLTQILGDANLRARLGRENKDRISPYLPGALARASQDWTGIVLSLGDPRRTQVDNL